MTKVFDTKGNEIVEFTLENSGENFEAMAIEFAFKNGYGVRGVDKEHVIVLRADEISDTSIKSTIKKVTKKTK